MSRREDIIKIAQEAGLQRNGYWEFDLVRLERFAALVAAPERINEAVKAERNKLAEWMMQYGFATGHGDTMEQLCDALGTEIVDRIEMEVKAEREACAKVCDERAMRCEKAMQDRIEAGEHDDALALRSTAWKISACAAVIRARGGK